MPDYVYGLILIESLGHEAKPNALRSHEYAARRKSIAFWRPAEKKLPTCPGDADNVAAAGA
jgi:hypothetical protein